MMFLYIILIGIFAAATWKKIETGIFFICALLPSYLIRFNIGGIPTTFLEIMVLIVITIWLIQQFPFRQTHIKLDHHLLIPISLLLLAAAIGIFVSPDKLAAFGVWKAFFIEPILLFVVIQDTIKKSSSLQENIFKAFGLSALLISIFGLIQYIFVIGIPAPWDLERRITSIFEYPNALALFLGPIIVISWFEIMKATKSTKVFWVLVSTLAMVNVFLAQSEAGIAALMITAACALLLSKSTRRKTIITILLLTTLLFTIPTSREYLIEKLTFADFSEQVRLSQWRETTELLKDHPVFGAGLSGYPIVMKQYHQELAYEIFQYPHNIFLNIWVELGLLGLIAFGYFVFGIWKLVWNTKNKFSHPSLSHSFTLLLFPLLFLEIFIHGLVDVPYFKNDLALMVWILIACAISSRTIQTSKTSSLS